MPQQDRVPFMLDACQYSGRSDFERDEWRDHPNTAVSWVGARHGAVPGVDAIPVPAVAGLAIEVLSFEILAAQLARERIAVHRIGTLLCVPPDSAHGAVLEFQHERRCLSCSSQ
ncbi:MAG: hypothetical protein ACREXP_23630 [Steroidobacteraceae bacterium]